ncbi:hypothetical protein APTSU1_000877600 [Apodemus speciosus]|uniref:Uncharacterized protein n=1 Tax=Apodemus speciosus TaxID=105296 RepID=A0ABQ0F2N7_APOSI
MVAFWPGMETGFLVSQTSSRIHAVPFQETREGTETAETQA